MQDMPHANLTIASDISITLTTNQRLIPSNFPLRIHLRRHPSEICLLQTWQLNVEQACFHDKSGTCWWITYMVFAKTSTQYVPLCTVLAVSSHDVRICCLKICEPLNCLHVNILVNTGITVGIVRACHNNKTLTTGDEGKFLYHLYICG